jgi:oligopeptide transport system substrate-binding protein
MRWTRKAERVGWRLLLLGSLAWAGCPDLPDGPRYQGHGNKQPQRGGTLMIWEEQRMRMLDPHVAYDVLSGVGVEMLFDSLYKYDLESRMLPAIAESLPVIAEDGRTFTVRLRHGVRFHNGREVTAQDVVWSFERMLSPELASPGAPYFRALEGFEAYQQKRTAHVSGVRALDSYTVEFRLIRPDQSFAHALAMRFAAPVPKEEVHARGVEFRRRPVGTGPFRLASWDRGVRLVFERNPTYYQRALPYLDRVVFEEGLKRDSAFLRFRNGEMDLMPRMTPADVHLLKTTPAWRPHMEMLPRADIYALFMNVELAPFDNVHLRRAVAFALDRERWARARNYNIRPAGQIVPPRMMGHDPNLPHLQRFDLERARAEMRLAGHPDGLAEPVTLWTSDSPASRAYGELAQADLAKIGIALRLKPVSFPVYLEETGKPRTAQMVSGGWNLDFPDPSNVLSLVSSASKAASDSSNRSFYSHPDLDALLERALVERDPQRRAAMYREANDFVADQAPWAFFCNTQAPQAWQPYVRGYRPHPWYWIPVTEVWLDLPRKRVAGVTRERARFSMREVPGRFAATPFGLLLGPLGGL